MRQQVHTDTRQTACPFTDRHILGINWALYSNHLPSPGPIQTAQPALTRLQAGLAPGLAPLPPPPATLTFSTQSEASSCPVASTPPGRLRPDFSPVQLHIPNRPQMLPLRRATALAGRAPEAPAASMARQRLSAVPASPPPGGHQGLLLTLLNGPPIAPSQGPLPPFQHCFRSFPPHVWMPCLPTFNISAKLPAVGRADLYVVHPWGPSTKHKRIRNKQMIPPLPQKPSQCNVTKTNALIRPRKPPTTCPEPPFPSCLQ